MSSDLRAADIEEMLQQVRKRLANREDRLEDADDHYAKDDRAPSAVQEYGIEPLRPNRGSRTAILRVRAHLDCPLAITARASDYRQFQGFGAGCCRGQKVLHRNDAFACGGADECDGSAQLAR